MKRDKQYLSNSDIPCQELGTVHMDSCGVAHIASRVAGSTCVVAVVRRHC